ncbi:class I adenylate-forming enzyme family protein [Ramlibacter sp.]|uniref:class I adenylate-forming enzyme family protein n=1 Tax=Ramlibacter sp. TaxID=1917967 RepID=UPI003D133BF4
MNRLTSLLHDVLALEPASDAIEFEKQWWTWGDLARFGQELDRILIQHGFGPGVRVACVMRNRPQMAAAIVGLVCTDRCVVTLNPMLPDARLAGDIATLLPPVVIALAQDWQRAPLADAAREAGCLMIEATNDRSSPLRILQAARPDAAVNREAPGIAVEMLTSGTTGTPKRVPLKAHTLERGILDAAVYENRDTSKAQLRGGVQLLNAPFAHISGVFALFNGLAAGRKLCLLDHFTVADWLDAVTRHRPPVTNAPPAALRMILDAKVPKESISSLKVFRVGTAPLDPDLADAFFAAYGIPVLQNYGATEFAGGVAGWTLADFKRFPTTKRGSVGRLNPGVEGRITDPESGKVLAPGEQGLLELKASHLGDGQSWLRTTDLAVLDEDGFLFIKARYDNVIIRGGFKVFPDDVARAIEAHPSVREAAVVGVSDARLGEVPMAAYIAKTGAAAVGEDEMRAFLQERLLKYQLPTRILAVDSLPRTPSLKVSQPELRKLFA